MPDGHTSDAIEKNATPTTLKIWKELGAYQFEFNDAQYRKGTLEKREPMKLGDGGWIDAEFIKGTNSAQGRVTLVYGTGSIYEGYFHANKVHFKGRKIFGNGPNNGDVYKGEFHQAMRHG